MLLPIKALHHDVYASSVVLLVQIKKMVNIMLKSLN